MPSGGDPRTAASVALPLSQVADRTAWLIADHYISPATITSNQDNYSPTGWSEADEVLLSSDATRTINGLDSNALKRRKLLVNVGSNNILIADLAAGQTAGNQVNCPGPGVPYLLRPGDALTVWKDMISGYWRCLDTPRGANYLWDGSHVWSNLCQFVQPLTLSSHCNIDGAGSGEYRFTGSRQRTILKPLSINEYGAGGNWGWASNFVYIIAVAAGPVMVPFELPSGAELTRVRAGIDDVSSSGVSFSVYKNAFDLGTNGIVRTLLGATTTSGGTAGPFTLSTGAFSETIANATNRYYAHFTSTAALQAVKWLEVQFNDPGPRSF